MGLQFHDFLAMGYSRKNPYPQQMARWKHSQEGGGGFWKSGWGEGSSGTGNLGMEGGEFFLEQPNHKNCENKVP